jgi:hypothetical protein
MAEMNHCLDGLINSASRIHRNRNPAASPLRGESVPRQAGAGGMTEVVDVRTL